MGNLNCQHSERKFWKSRTPFTALDITLIVDSSYVGILIKQGTKKIIIPYLFIFQKLVSKKKIFSSLLRKSLARCKENFLCQLTTRKFLLPKKQLTKNSKLGFQSTETCWKSRLNELLKELLLRVGISSRSCVLSVGLTSEE